MIKHIAAKRYALALYQLAKEQNILDRTYRGIHLLSQFSNSSKDFQNFLESPEITSENRIAVFDKLFKKRVDPVVYTFLIFLLQKDRLALLPEICDEFENQYHEEAKILPIMVTSALEMKEDALKKLTERLKIRYPYEIHSEQQVDPLFISGFNVQVRDTVHDFTVRTQLEKIKNDIMNH